ncbi:hypothetical protein RUMGNA_02309 [Mediterraneibacter gnavus ATCC 29149]|uniref:Uncharacterized protein n=1 Tax=Mediterraneibacter gnavus (strain ATCC 29149 / DSM 114966 / JCM 6515 / VPI C7-9) TaxID=411470 RepID=A7B426_MEDG7|nr:hypothetical protein RUMGNA_02309 [Mediterraneibacter gnavus ATCC 29149]
MQTRSCGGGGFLCVFLRWFSLFIILPEVSVSNKSTIFFEYYFGS